MVILVIQLLIILSAMEMMCCLRWSKTFSFGWKKECECFCKPRSKIVGGEVVTDENMYPFMVVVINKNICGGTLITRKHVLTAAHCLIKHTIITDTSAIFRPLDLKETPIRIFAKEAVMHEEYKRDTNVNDIGIITLEKSVEYTSYIRPACLPRSCSSKEKYAGRKMTIIGIGHTQEKDGKLDGKLRHVQVHSISLQDCKEIYYDHQFEVLDTHLCAGYEKGMKDSCSGDSGGPIVVRNKGVFILAGIVSWGGGCARENQPGVYARVDKYIEWIEKHVGDACLCFEEC